MIAIVTSVAILFSACKKINESTELGGSLIPPVDGINTFDTSLYNVQVFNDTFGLMTDSFRLDNSQEFFVGKINTDQFFGKTDARVFLELKPITFPFSFGNSNPSKLFIDSVVFIMDYVETYGDTNTVQSVNVYEIDQIPSNNFNSDSIYLIRKEPVTYSGLLGSRTFAPKILNDSVKALRDTTVNQLRIRLDNSFGSRLLSYDSIKTSINGAYANDSAFKTKFKGFAIRSMNTGNSLMGFNLNGVNTKLAIYYRNDTSSNATPKYDTTIRYFGFNGLNCASANYVQRDYVGSALAASVGGAVADQVIYIQATPGSFATIKIPDLATLSNRVIHRAELIIEQLYDISDSVLKPPPLLYLDAIDPTITANEKFRTIPYDVTFSNSGELNLFDYGSLPSMSTDVSGNNIRIWKFNLSRYVQHVLNGTLPLYDLRLHAPFTVSEQFGTPPGSDVRVQVSVNNSIAKGRVRLGGTNHPTQKIKLRLIYSKL